MGERRAYNGWLMVVLCFACVSYLLLSVCLSSLFCRLVCLLSFLIALLCLFSLFCCFFLLPSSYCSSSFPSWCCLVVAISYSRSMVHSVFLYPLCSSSSRSTCYHQAFSLSCVICSSDALLVLPLLLVFYYFFYSSDFFLIILLIITNILILL